MLRIVGRSTCPRGWIQVRMVMPAVGAVRAELGPRDVRAAPRRAPPGRARPGTVRRARCPSSRSARTAPPRGRTARPPAPRGAATVGSSPYTSSPTSALAIAARIASVGWVRVSLRRSITRILTTTAGDQPDVCGPRLSARPHRPGPLPGELRGHRRGVRARAPSTCRVPLRTWTSYVVATCRWPSAASSRPRPSRSLVTGTSDEPRHRRVDRAVVGVRPGRVKVSWNVARPDCGAAVPEALGRRGRVRHRVGEAPRRPSCQAPTSQT